MILSRNWLNEFVDLKDITDKQFNDDMTLSGSKVETIERPDENLKNVVVGKILEMKRHENSDHMWVLKIDVGQAEPVQIVSLFVFYATRSLSWRFEQAVFAARVTVPSFTRTS